MRILYRDGEAWIDLREAPWCTEIEPQEREALALFSAGLPAVPQSIQLSDGIGFYMLISSGTWLYDDEPSMYADYGLCVDVESPLPWA